LQVISKEFLNITKFQRILKHYFSTVKHCNIRVWVTDLVLYPLLYTTSQIILEGKALCGMKNIQFSSHSRKWHFQRAEEYRNQIVITDGNNWAPSVHLPSQIKNNRRQTSIEAIDISPFFLHESNWRQADVFQKSCWIQMDAY
jgi:hypothetical protein